MTADVAAPSRPAPDHPGRRRLPLTSARKTILALGVPVAVAIIGAVAFSLVAAVGTDSYPVSYQIPISASRLTVNLGGGNLSLQGAGAGGSARLTGTVTYTFARPDISVTDPDRQGAIVSLDCRVPTGDCGLNAALSLPAGTAATIATGGGNLTAAGLTGYASLSTGGGDLTAAGLTGYASLSTDGGNLTATSIDSAQVTADSGGGDIELAFTRVPRNVQVSADGGNVTIIVPAGSAGYDVTTNTDGGNLSDSVPLSSYSPRTINVSSGGGDITIERAG